MTGIKWLLGCAMLAASACGQAPSEPLGNEHEATEVAAAPAAQKPTDGSPGFVHRMVKSKFRLGDNVTGRSEFGLQKTIGSEGVFATVPDTGWSLGIPNADAPSKTVGPLTNSAEDHNRAVLDYFVAAGLPADQVARVNAHATMHASSTLGPKGYQPGPDVFEGYSSVITRAVSGIPVADSFAWASFNANGDVVEEGVYWPPIARSVIDGAAALRASLADPASAAPFLAKLPQSAMPGRVAIRHSPGAPGTPFEAAACYDTIDSSGGGKVRERHFNAAGTEFELAHEMSKVSTTAVRHR